MKRRPLAALPFCAFCAFGAAALVPACIDPHDDYNDFEGRTDGVRGAMPPASDAAVIEASAIDGGYSNASFFVACIPSLAGGKVSEALRFAATITYAPTSNDSKAGTMALLMQPLPTTATDLSQVVGTQFGPMNVPVDAQGNFTANMGAPTLPAEANPISTNAIVFGSATITGTLLRSDYACGLLTGVITAPMMIDLTDPTQPNYCIFQRFPAPSGALPTLTIDQFHCP